MMRVRLYSAFVRLPSPSVDPSITDEVFGSMVDVSLCPCDGFKASVTDAIPIALLKIMLNEGGPVS
jgi:hypothetical protein